MTTIQVEEENKPIPKPKHLNQQTPQNPNQEKIIIFVKNYPDVPAKLEDILQKCNAKPYGTAITTTDIFTRAIRNFSETDMMALQKDSIKSDMDLLKFEWSKSQLKDEEKIEFDAWLIRKLKLKNIIRETQNADPTNKENP